MTFDKGDRGTKVHTDDSDVTFNVNIFENYTGAPLVAHSSCCFSTMGSLEATFPHLLGVIAAMNLLLGPD